MNEIAIIFAFSLLGAFAHYWKKALDGELWRGDTEPNPFRAQFWTDWKCWVTERPGRTASAVVTCAGTAFVLANGFGDIHSVELWKLAATGVTSGFIGDSFNKADPS